MYALIFISLTLLPGKLELSPIKLGAAPNLFDSFEQCTDSKNAILEQNQSYKSLSGFCIPLELK